MKSGTYGKTIVSQFPHESRSAYAVAGKTFQIDPQPVATSDFAARLLRS
jgi:hypothetical protein